jgi:alpha-2-macroglobulin
MVEVEKRGSEREEAGAGGAAHRVRTDFAAAGALRPGGARPTPRAGPPSPVKLPDNLTRYRVMVVAVAGGASSARRVDDHRAHAADGAALAAALPQLRRPLRAAGGGAEPDRRADEVEVAVRATNAAHRRQRPPRHVPANDRVEVRFPAAAEMPGTAASRSRPPAGQPSIADAAELLAAGVDAGHHRGVRHLRRDRRRRHAQPVIAPRASSPSSAAWRSPPRRPSCRRSPTPALPGQLPFECSEQLASRVLAVAALRDVLSAFEAEGLPPPAEIEAAVERDIEAPGACRTTTAASPSGTAGAASWPY